MASKATRADQSLADQIADLPLGESLSRSQRFPIAEVAEEGIKEGVAKLRAALNQTVSRVRKRTGQEYRVESGTLLTDDQEAIIATVCVTRLGEAADGDDDLGI